MINENELQLSPIQNRMLKIHAGIIYCVKLIAKPFIMFLNMFDETCYFSNYLNQKKK
jgi:hypothetical protein